MIYSIAATSTTGARSRARCEAIRAAASPKADMAVALGIRQSDVSKLERRGDVRLASLRRYVAALGGELAIVVQFADGAARLDLDGARPLAERRGALRPGRTDPQP